jgi:hypothetical protein
MVDRPAERSAIHSLLRRLLRPKHTSPPVTPFTPLSVLEDLHAGTNPDYCLYLRPAVQAPSPKTLGQMNAVESMMIRAFAPLPVLAVEEMGGAGPHALPDESFHTLAEAARVLWLVPTDDERFIERLRQFQEKQPLGRCIFLMPEQGSFGQIDWPQTWAAARAKAAEFGIELSPYTAGGWLFRLGPDGKACTFRPIVNPNHEKIVRALEAICGEME